MAAEQETAPKEMPYPAVGAIFILSINGDDPENDPMEMVYRDGHNPEGWEHIGKKVKGLQTRGFKLVHGYDIDPDELEEYGKIPEGQWLKAFKKRFSKADGKSNIGAFDPSWIDPDGFSNFPYIDSDGDLRLQSDDYDWHHDWYWNCFWLLEVIGQNQPLRAT